MNTCCRLYPLNNHYQSDTLINNGESVIGGATAKKTFTLSAFSAITATTIPL